ncbi:MAG: hypothetical protein LUP95_04885 [Euryarchaeota archaeon]|nr:hypothetical protein [Euryarchaeota archaeon]
MTSRVLTILAVLACILVACSGGCLTPQLRDSNISSTTIAQPSVTPPTSNSSRLNASTSISGNPAGDLNAYFSENAVIIMPFKLVTIGERVAFIGMVEDKKDELPQMQHNLTYVQCGDKKDANEQVQVFSSEAQSRGYARTASLTSDNITYWLGYKGETSDTVMISSCESGRCETGLGRTYAPSFGTSVVAVDYVSESY